MATQEVTAQPNLIVSVAALVALIGAATLCGAWFFQYVLDIRPCPLCLEQRYGYYLAIPLAAVIAWSGGRLPRAVALAGLAVIALAMTANGALGVYHSGVEWGFWPGPTDCSGPPADISGGNLLGRLGNVKVIRCDEVQWRFLGLSLAGYNVLISAAMAALAVMGIVKRDAQA
ncbi:MAG: disulfide bond formation protein B [Xanthobacteraceae bacterium]|nr:MAG: disulfide bond formation protein B [Xanthobacteraceae bacterium]